MLGVNASDTQGDDRIMAKTVPWLANPYLEHPQNMHISM